MKDQNDVIDVVLVSSLLTLLNFRTFSNLFTVELEAANIFRLRSDPRTTNLRTHSQHNFKCFYDQYDV